MNKFEFILGDIIPIYNKGEKWFHLIEVLSKNPSFIVQSNLNTRRLFVQETGHVFDLEVRSIDTINWADHRELEGPVVVIKNEKKYILMKFELGDKTIHLNFERLVN